MAVTYVNAQETDWTSATQSPVVNAPSGIQDNDLILIFLVTNTDTTVTAPSGWTMAGSQTPLADFTSALIYKIASSEGSSWTLTNVFNSTEVGRAVVIVYRGMDTTTPINQVNQATVTATSISGPSITPGINNCMIVQFAGADPGVSAYSATPDSSPVATERFDGKDANNNAYVFIQEYLQSTAAAIALDATNLTNDSYGYHQIAIAPSSGPSPQTINLSTVTLAGSVPVGDAVPGAVSLTMATISLAGSMPVASIQAVTTLIMATLNLAGSVPKASVQPGAVSLTMTTINLVGSVPAASISSPAPGTNVQLNTITLAGSVPTGSIQPGAVSIVLAALTLQGSMPAGSIQPGAVSVILAALGLAGSVEAATISSPLSGINIPLNTLSLAGSMPAAGVQPGAISVALLALLLAGSIPSLAVSVGGTVTSAQPDVRYEARRGSHYDRREREAIGTARR